MHPSLGYFSGAGCLSEHRERYLLCYPWWIRCDTYFLKTHQREGIQHARRTCLRWRLTALNSS
jgi:hypothetical protein